MGWLKDYAKGVSTKGVCAECGHGDRAAPGCDCSASWCPCHAAWNQHRLGAHSCLRGDCDGGG